MKRLLFIMIIFGLIGCRTQKEIVSTTHDTVIVKQYQLMHDSVFVDRYHNIYISGDTVFKTDSVFKLMYKYEQIHDTLSIHTTDTLTTVTTKTTPSERSGYDMFVSWGFWILLVLIILWIAIRIIYRIYLKR